MKKESSIASSKSEDDAAREARRKIDRLNRDKRDIERLKSDEKRLKRDQDDLQRDLRRVKDSSKLITDFFIISYNVIIIYNVILYN